MKIDFAFFSAVAASHFRAVSLQYRKRPDDKLDIIRSIGWRRASGYDDFGGCQRSQFGTRSLRGQVHEEITGISGPASGRFPSYYTLSNLEDDPSIDSLSHWCFGNETFTIELNGVTSFTHTGSSCCTIPFLSDIGGIGAGSTRYTGIVNDVNNDGPDFPVRPIWVIMEHCLNQVYRVDPITSTRSGVYPLRDPEGDKIRCRWATASEAAHFAYQPAIMQSFLLDEERCTVTYRPEFDSSGPGNKPIALMVEDLDAAGNVLHASPSFFIAITFQPDVDNVRGDLSKLIYSESYPEHDEHHHDDRRRRQVFSEPSYCTGRPEFVTDDLSDEQKKYFKWVNIFDPFAIPGRKRREGDDDDDEANPNLITIPWAASYQIGDTTFYDFPRAQFTMPEGMTCTDFDERGEATCTWIPTAAQAIQGKHSHCAQIYDPYGRGSERLCMTLVLEIEPACEEGYEHAVADDGLGVVCVDINECLDADACGTNASCENNDGGYVCNCDDGYIKDDTDECVFAPMEYSDAVRTLKTWINMTSDVLADHGRVDKFTLRTGKLARNALNSIDSDCEVVYNDEKYQGNDFAVWDRDHERSDDYCIQTTQMKEGFQAFINNYSCKDGKKAKQVKRVSKFIEKINNPYC